MSFIARYRSSVPTATAANRMRRAMRLLRLTRSVRCDLRLDLDFSPGALLREFLRRPGSDFVGSLSQVRAGITGVSRLSGCRVKDRPTVH